jgi:hypothetical protein
MLFSGTKYVTANLFFPKVCEVKLKLNTWGHDENELIRKMSVAMIAKFDKYWSDIHGLMVVAVIIDPHLKMTMLHVYYIDLFGEVLAEQHVSDAYELLTELMKHYQVKEPEFVSSSSSGSSLLVLLSYCQYSNLLVQIRRLPPLLEVKMSWIDIWKKKLFLIMRMTTLTSLTGGGWRGLGILI